jgi:hypothetical protein
MFGIPEHLLIFLFLLVIIAVAMHKNKAITKAIKIFTEA